MRKVQIWTVLLLLFAVASCFKDPHFDSGFSGEDSGTRTQPQRSYSESSRRVMIMISGGFNSLSSYLTQDLQDLEEGYLPEGTYYNSDVLLVLARKPERSGNYTPTAPVLYRLYKDREGETHRDTLKLWSEDTPLCKSETLYEALSFVQRKFPDSHYGIVFSSHATGWLPEGYYSDPSAYESKSPRGYRTLGQDIVGNSGVEMELQEFADAIPMHLEYLLIDACLSGCVEVAYAFKDKTDIIGFSPTEVLADGFNYLEITRHLLNADPDPVGVCREYFDYYDAQSGNNRSATISVLDTRRMESLAEVCRELFEKYRSQISTLDGNRVQGFFRYNKHYFYDLRDILVQAGITSRERARLDEALEECILYKAATPYFLNFRISQYCGLSMYLPSMGTPFLDSFYVSQMDWNKATQLVK